MQNVQNHLVTIIQDMHKKVDKMYTDWKATGFCGRTENDTKWFEVSVLFFIVINIVIFFIYIQ